MSAGRPLLNICAHMASGYFEWVMLKNALDGRPTVFVNVCIEYLMIYLF